MTDDATPALVDAYFEDRLVGEDETLRDALVRSEAAGLVPHSVSPTQGAFLSILARAMGAKRILEVGTLGGYSTIWLARAVGEGGQVVTLEVDEATARVARENLEAAGLASVTDLRLGPARDTLDRMIADGAAPFDLVFIDADKPNNPAYLERALKLSRPGTVIIGDNVVRGGAVADASSVDPKVQGVRAYLDMLGEAPNLTSTAIQTVGSKGYDGFAITVVE